MVIFSTIFLLVQILIIPFFIRLLLHFHQVDKRSSFCQYIDDMTNSMLKFFSYGFPPTSYFDRPAIIFIFLALFCVAQLRSVFSMHSFSLAHIGLFILCESFNKICIIYIISGLIAYLGQFVSSREMGSLVNIAHQLVYRQIQLFSSFLQRAIPESVFVSRWSFWIWLGCLSCLHLLLSHEVMLLLYGYA
jgi:hypothetical protein